MASVNVVSQHKYEIETDEVMVGFHLLGDFVLLFLSRPTVADYPKAHRFVFER